MKKIQHRQLLKKNGLNPKALLNPIADKIEVFDRLYKLWASTTDEKEKNQSLAQLEELDLEIMEDIEDVHHDLLSNNEFIEEPPKEKPKKACPNKITDADIIKAMVVQGITKNVGRSVFKKLGIKATIENGVVIGDYRLKRVAVFQYKYDLIKITA